MEPWHWLPQPGGEGADCHRHPPASFLSLQKNVTLQCVFWVEDLTCECGGGSELGRDLEAGSGGS